LYNRALYLSSVLPTPKIPHILLLFSTNFVRIVVKELEDMSI